jgi:hypothetical protein
MKCFEKSKTSSKSIVVIKKMLKQFFLYALKMQEGVKWPKDF